MMIEQGNGSRYIEIKVSPQKRGVNTSALSAISLSVVLNGLMLLGFAMSMRSSEPSNSNIVSNNYFSQHSVIKAILIKPSVGVLQPQVSKSVVQQSNSLKIEGSTATPAIPSKQEGQGDSNVSARNEGIEESIKGNIKNTTAPVNTLKPDPNLPELMPAPISLPSAIEIKRAASNYIKHLEQARLQHLAEDAINKRKNASAQGERKIIKPFKSEEELLIESMQIVVDCTTKKGALFNFLSRNKGVVLEDRDLPSFSHSSAWPSEGTVKCRDHSNFSEYIDKRVKK
ncbi:hypothetical protein [Alteromonas gracilis]|uniref:hypothetical protein n=1 Tax=Alteromonas gracilis TaxID=1479524 RepID=UPI00373503BB